MRTLAAIVALARLGLATRWRLDGKYWSWRHETAFGSDPSRWPRVQCRRHATMEYARWVADMRRMIAR